MKKNLGLLLIFLGIISVGCTVYAQPTLSNTAVHAEMENGVLLWQIDFESTEGGMLAMQLTSGDIINLGAAAVEAGTGCISWDGCRADGAQVSPGTYTLALQLKNFWGEESNTEFLPIIIGASAERLDLSVLEDAQEVQIWEENGNASYAQVEELTATVTAAAEEQGVPYATSFWDMNPDAYDLSNPEHQQAIWDLMMQPITVFDVGQTDHVYPTNEPGMNRTPYETNCAGELHGQSQGIHVLEEDLDGDGYVLIEAYSNDGTKTDNAYMESIDNKRIQGYVKKSLLITKQPSTKYALLIDKMRQKLYIFEAGRIIGTLDVSTGLNNDKQPYNETPAGEYITVSKVGEFVSGTMRAQYAIRINGGTLLHEVPYRYGKDGTTKIYDEFEPELGKKASHGCIRIQRRKNAEGQNMLWLWNNLENKTRVFIWNDQGRQMIDPEPPDANLQLFRNPNGGSNYHLDANCSGVKAKFLPLTGDFTYGDLTKDDFKKLTPCVYCGAPQRPETLYDRYMAEAAQVGAVLDETAVKAAFGITN